MASENSIVSRYALKSPREYYAESVATYVMKVVSEKRFQHLESKAKTRVNKKFKKHILLTTKLGIDNLPRPGIDFMEDELKLNSNLYFNRTYKRKDGLRGKWQRRN